MSPSATDPATAKVLALAEELGGLAAGLCLDVGIGLEVAPGGWSFDPVRRVIRVSQEGLQTKGPEYCAGIVAHEVGHYFITRYNLLPLRDDQPPLAAVRSLLNAIEDPRVDRWITSRYPGARPWQNQALVDELSHAEGSPWYLLFTLECAAEGDRNWRPSARELPAPVVEALAATREARHRYALLAPPTEVDAPVEADVSERYREEVWPVLHEVRWIPSRREQRVQLSAYDAHQLAEDEILPAARALYEIDRRRLASWLAAKPAHGGQGRRLLEAGRPGPVVGQAMREGILDPRPAPPWAQELAQELLDAYLTGQVRAPMVVGIRTRPGRSRPRGASGELPPLPPVWQPRSDYDRLHQEVAVQVDQLVGHLEEVLRPRRRLQERAGYPTGRKVELRRLMAFEADPRRYDELWTRTTIPDRRNAAIGLLVDLSGSMQGDKTRSAVLGTILLAETLHRLEVPFAIDGFQDVLIPLHAFHEPLRRATRQRISEIPQEVSGSRPGGNNQPGYNDDGPCLLEFAEKLLDQPAADRILVVVSDGIPEGRRSSAPDLHAAVRQLTEQGGLRLIALGLGPGTQHVRTFYPESVADVPLPRFAETIGALVERVLVGDI